MWDRRIPALRSLLANGPRNLSRICFLFDDSAAIIEMWADRSRQMQGAPFVATLFHRDVKACAVTYAAHQGFVAGIGEIRRGQSAATACRPN